MIDKLNKLSNWLKNNDLKEESLIIFDMLSKYGEADADGEEDISSGEYWDFHIDNTPSGWDSSNFSPEDLMSRGNRRVKMYKPALRALNSVASRRPAGQPVRLTNQVDSSKNGGYRDRAYNSSVGGVSNSQHIKGKAFDIYVSDYNREERLLLLQALVDAGFVGFGHGKNVIHADFGPKRTWTYAGYQKPSEEEYRGGLSGIVSVREETSDSTYRDEPRSRSRSSSRSSSKSCSPPFDNGLLDNIRFGEELRYGARGPEVGSMQTMLEEHGHILAKFGIDCIFKSETQSRLKDFQAASELEPTGVLDSLTLALLEEDVFDAKEPEEGIAIILNEDTIYPIRRNASVDLVVFYHGNTGNKDVLEGLKALDLKNTMFLIPNGEFRDYNQVKVTIEQLSENYGITINNKKLGAWSAGSKGFMTAEDEDFAVKMLADPAPFAEVIREAPSGVYMEYNPEVWSKSSADSLPILARRIEANGGRAKPMPGVSHKAILNSILSQLV